jgi:hypothetical protein
MTNEEHVKSMRRLETAAFIVFGVVIAMITAQLTMNLVDDRWERDVLAGRVQIVTNLVPAVVVSSTGK